MKQPRNNNFRALLHCNHFLDTLNCFFTNARGLISKIDVLREYAINLNLAIIGVAETFLNVDISNAEVKIDGYKMFRKDRSAVKEGKCGGVILYVKEDIVSYECRELNASKNESIWIKLKTDNTSELTIGVCYRSQVADDLELKSLYENIEKASEKQVLIMGDFNFPNINWETLDSDTNSSQFRDLILDNYLHQHVKEPTRNNNILDLIITSDISLIEKISVMEHLGNSDHNILTWKLICRVDTGDNKLPVRQYNKANYDDIRDWLANIDWNVEFKRLDVDDVWNKFYTIMQTVVTKFVPLGHRKNKKFPKWMNRVTKSARKYKSRMWDRYRQSKSYNDLVEYRRSQNKAVKEYRKAKKQFEKKLARDVKNNPKNFFAYCRSKTKVKETVGPLKNKDGQYVFDNVEMSELLNDYFGSVFTDENVGDKLPEVKYKFSEDNNHMLNTVPLRNV